MKLVVLGVLFVVAIVVFLAIMGTKETSYWMDDSFRWGTRDKDKQVIWIGAEQFLPLFLFVFIWRWVVF